MEKQTHKNESLNFEKVWIMFKETREWMKEQSLETDKKFQATDKKFQATDKKIDKVLTGLKEVQGEVSGIGKSNGEVAEDFFYNGLSGRMQIGNTKFEFIDRNQKRFSKKHNIRDEYDILLTNDKVIVIVEIKYKARKKHVEQLLTRKIPNFRKLFPRYADYKVIGAIAGFTFEDKAQDMAQNNGFYVFTQAGDDISIVSDTIKYY